MAIFVLQNESFMSSQQPKVALVHDDMVQSGGAEKLFEAIAEIYPKAPIYTSLADRSKVLQSLISSNEERPRQRLRKDAPRLHTSFIQKIPFAQKLYKILLPLYPLAFESFNFDKYDVVISSTTRFAKAIITKPQTVHICYINSVPRFLWDDKALSNYLPYILRLIVKPYFAWLKKWDLVASSRPDFYIANSRNIADSVKKIYGRESKVVYPLVDTDYFVPAKEKPQDLGPHLAKPDRTASSAYFLIVTRLVKWKKIEIAIHSVKESDQKLIIVGDGSDRNRLEKIAKSNPNIFFAGKIPNSQLKLYYQFAKALIVTQEEDFGISTLEAQACGAPVIAYQKGGQMEIVIDGKTGIFFPEQTAKSLKRALERFSRVKWDKSACRKNSLRFTKERFVNEFEALVLEYAEKR